MTINNLSNYRLQESIQLNNIGVGLDSDTKWTRLLLPLRVRFDLHISTNGVDYNVEQYGTRFEQGCYTILAGLLLLSLNCFIQYCAFFWYISYTPGRRSIRLAVCPRLHLWPPTFFSFWKGPFHFPCMLPANSSEHKPRGSSYTTLAFWPQYLRQFVERWQIEIFSLISRGKLGTFLNIQTIFRYKHRTQ